MMHTTHKRVQQAGTLYALGGAIWFLTIIGSQLVGLPWSEAHTGLYPLIFMFPIVAITGETLDMAIGFWGLARLALGLAIRAQASEPAFVAGEVAR